MGFVAPITGGSPADDVAVVALAHGNALECTGTLIAPHAVLTAAHCVASPQLPELAIGSTLAGAVRQAAAAALVHPDFDPVSLDHDIAVIVVEPLAMPTIPIATVVFAGPGTTMRVVGYGWTVAGDTSPPQQRTGTSRIDAIDALRITSSAAPSQACEGDSGGPALLDTGSGEQVIGVASSGDPACTMFAKHTRVDTHLDFVLGVVARSAPGAAAAGDRCFYDANCAEGPCMPARDEPRWSFCAPACASAAACPADLTCVDAHCVHALPSPGAAGAACASDADCAGALCLAPSGGSERVCTQHCFADLGATCPGGEACTGASDGQQACFAADDGGCRTTRRSSPWLALLVLGYVLRGRGRP